MSFFTALILSICNASDNQPGIANGASPIIMPRTTFGSLRSLAERSDCSNVGLEFKGSRLADAFYVKTHEGMIRQIESTGRGGALVSSWAQFPLLQVRPLIDSHNSVRRFMNRPLIQRDSYFASLV